jgi:hypothetical protein
MTQPRPTAATLPLHVYVGKAAAQDIGLSE